MQPEEADCKPLDPCASCDMAMSQVGETESLPPTVGPEPLPQPGTSSGTPVYPRKLTMTLLYEAQQKDTFLRYLFQVYVKAP